MIVRHDFRHHALVAESAGDLVAHFHLSLRLHDDGDTLLGVFDVGHHAGRMMLPRHRLVRKSPAPTAMDPTINLVPLLGDEHKGVTEVHRAALFDSPVVVEVFQHLFVVLSREQRHKSFLADVGVVVPLGFMLIHVLAGESLGR